MSDLQLDRAGRRRSPATMPGFLAGRSPRNKGLRYPADPPKVEEIMWRYSRNAALLLAPLGDIRTDQKSRSVAPVVALSLLT